MCGRLLYMLLWNEWPWVKIISFCGTCPGKGSWSDPSFCSVSCFHYARNLAERSPFLMFVHPCCSPFPFVFLKKSSIEFRYIYRSRSWSSVDPLDNYAVLFLRFCLIRDLTEAQATNHHPCNTFIRAYRHKEQQMPLVCMCYLLIGGCRSNYTELRMVKCYEVLWVCQMLQMLLCCHEVWSSNVWTFYKNVYMYEKSFRDKKTLSKR